MPKEDIIEISIISGGKIRITTKDSISGANHTDAEDIIKGIDENAGGPVTTEHLKKGFTHTHTNADGSTTTHSH